MLTRSAIARPVLTAMFFTAIILMGWVAKARMPVELSPKTDFPFVSVVTIYAGAGPQEIETLVSKPIEDAVGSTANVKNVTSTSQDGISVVGIEFEIGTDTATAASDVREKVDAIRSSLPDGIEAPSIAKVDFSAMPILTIGMRGPVPPRQMRDIADNVVKDRLARVRGAASVSVSGGDVREIRVVVNRSRLAAYGLTISDISAAIQRENLNLPGGSIKQDRQDYAIRVVGEFASAEEVAGMRLHIPDRQTGGPGWNIPLTDIATVQDTVEEQTTVSRLNGQPTVVIAVQKQTDANTVGVAEGAKKELEALKNSLPPGVEFVIATDDSEFVLEQLHDTNKELMLGILLVVLVVFIFLHSFRATLVVSLAIPTSLIATFIPMTAFGFTLNYMTMLALSLAVGILVDDAIVVLENIDRHLEEGEPPREAAINGRTEIALAAVTITLVDVVVFIPIAFMGGIVGQFFRSFGITVAAATLFSLLVSFTLTPMMASRFFQRETKTSKRRHEAERHGFWERRFEALEGFYRRIDERYRRILAWSLDNRWLTFVIGAVTLTTILIMMSAPMWRGGAGPRLFNLIVFVGILGLSGFIFSKDRKIALAFMILAAALTIFVNLRVKGEFFPESDRGQVAIEIETPAGSSLKHTLAIAEKVETIVSKLPEAEYYQTVAGSSSASGAMWGGNVGPQYGRVSLELVDVTKRKRSINEVMAVLREQILTDVAGAQIKVYSAENTGPSGAPVAMEVMGSSMTELNTVAGLVKDAIQKVEGTRDVETSWKIGRPELEIKLDRQRAMDRGITTAQVADAVRTSVEGSTTSKFRVEGTEYNIRVQVDASDRATLESVQQLIVGTNDGVPVYLQDVADVRLSAAPTKIDRKNRQRLVTVSAYLEEGADLSSVQRRIDKAIAPIPKGSTTVRTGGTSEIQQESFRYILQSLFLAVALVYMLMAGLFESLFNPLVIMFSLPQALVGAILLLVLRGQSLSIISMIGMIMLMGIVTKNAILLIDYTNTLRKRGMSRREAILLAGPTRLRPILMTTMSLLAALTPTMLALSRGSEQRSPLATAVIGGLLVSTLLTLLVIPSLYTLMEDALHFIARKLGFRKEETPE